MTATRRTLHHQSGLTVVELLISLALSMLMLYAASTMYVSTKQSTRVQEATSQLVESGRAATESLNRSIRMARYFGCVGPDPDSVTNHYDTSTPVQSPTYLNGYDQQGIFGIDGSTDEITVFQARDSERAPLAEGLTLEAGVTAMKLAAGHGFSAGDMIALTDCVQADVFNVSAVDTGASPNELAYANCATCSHTFLAGSSVLRVARSRYYIADGTSGEPSLFVEDPLDAGDTPVELVRGVEDLQITYGVDTDADGVANQYVSPATINALCTAAGNNTCWRSVSSVRIALLLRSAEDNVVLQPQNYRFNGSSFAASDKRLRREFLTIVALRNYRP
jgi:type IV pilus assembly protein PilW